MSDLHLITFRLRLLFFVHAQSLPVTRGGVSLNKNKNMFHFSVRACVRAYILPLAHSTVNILFTPLIVPLRTGTVQIHSYVHTHSCEIIFSLYVLLFSFSSPVRRFRANSGMLLKETKCTRISLYLSLSMYSSY